LYVFAMLIGHMGMDNGLFYFIKTYPGKEGLFSLNVVFFDLAMASLLALGGLALGRPWRGFFNNVALADHFPVFSLLVLFPFPLTFEHYLAVIDDIKGAIVLSVTFEAIKAVVIVGGFLLLWLTQGSSHRMTALALLKLLWLLGFNLFRVRASGATWNEGCRYFRKQVDYSLPQGFKN